MDPLKIGFLIDPFSAIDPRYDTSFALMRESVRRGHRVFGCEVKDLRVHHNTVEARLTKCVPDPARGLLAGGGPRWTPLSALDAFFIRKDPPFDLRYVSAMTLLTLTRDAPVMINDPAGILTTNEKLSTLPFEPFSPPGAAGSTPEAFADFLRQRSPKGWVFKPLFYKGGRGITWVRPDQLAQAPAVVRRLTKNGREPVLCQKFVDHAREGDKRILILDGRILGAMRRIAKPGEFRANLSKGATAAPATVTARERAMIKRLTPLLRSRGLHLVGIDVLAGYLSEINVTSPSGAPEINAFNGGRVEAAVLDFAERRAAVRRRSSGRACRRPA